MFKIEYDYIIYILMINYNIILFYLENKKI